MAVTSGQVSSFFVEHYLICVNLVLGFILSGSWQTARSIWLTRQNNSMICVNYQCLGGDFCVGSIPSDTNKNHETPVDLEKESWEEDEETSAHEACPLIPSDAHKIHETPVDLEMESWEGKPPVKTYASI
ncbi:putative G3BP-like protein isoform X3, partial [Sesbania bispinosa]